MLTGATPPVATVTRAGRPLGFRIRAVAGSLITAVLISVGLVTVGLAGTATPASAHSWQWPYPSCPGRQIAHYHSFDGAVSLYVFYSSANGGTNCIWAQKQRHRGTAEGMNLVLGRCDSGVPGNCDLDQVRRDRGDFRYYAGPLTVTRSAGRCIIANVALEGFGWHRRGPFHCG